MDLASVTFIGLQVIGLVNVLSIFQPNMDSRMKFGISVVAAFVLTFIPPDMGNIILQKEKLAIETALAATGGYKLATKAGGK